jgi:murein DD-endopeptidase MepM/ murein hydrolase activator NlpD
MAYVNPIGKGLTVGRIDEGVDFAGAGPLYAMANGVIKGVYDSGWPGGTYILLHMDDGKDVYYAENIAPSVKTGQRVKAGQQIGYARGSYPFIEVGWSTSREGSPVAQSHYKEGQQTAEGKDFAALLGTFGWHIPGAASSSTMGGSGGGTGGVQTTSAIGGLFSWPGDVLGFFKDAKTFVDALLWIVNPASWLRIGAFLVGTILILFAIYALLKVGSDEPLFSMPKVVPVPV